MKKGILYICLLLFFCTCEKPFECVESTGEIVNQEYDITAFDRIEVHQGIELIVSEGNEYKITVQTGENLIENIEVIQNQNTIILKDNTKCNWVREYGQTKVFITAPNLTEIYSKTDRNISSNGVLTFPTLKLFAFDPDADHLPGAGTGDFHLQINNQYLETQSNNVARFYISGNTDVASFSIYFGDTRIDSPNLIAKEVIVYHRGSNDIITFPVNKISGKLVSTGDLILKNNPPIVDVEVLYQGQLIIN